MKNKGGLAKIFADLSGYFLFKALKCKNNSACRSNRFYSTCGAVQRRFLHQMEEQKVSNPERQNLFMGFVTLKIGQFAW